MTNYTWTTTNLYTINLATESDYVVTAIYNVSATDGTYSATLDSNSCQFIVDDDKPNYIPYEDLTNDIVIAWVQETIGVDGVTSITNCLDGQIESQINPPVTPQNTPLPF
jgi:hypothetical protein